MRLRLLAAALSFAWSVTALTLLSSAAHAEEALVLPTQGTSARASDADRLFDRIRTRLTSAGLTVRPVPSASIERAAAVLACDTSSCSRAGLDALSTDFIVAPSLWQTSSGDFELSCNVLGRSGVVAEFSRSITRDALHGNEIADALGDEIVAHLADLRRPADESSRVASADPMLASRASTDSPRSGANLGIGLGLVAASIVPAVLGASALARRGDCAEVGTHGGCARDNDGSAYFYAFGARSGVALGAGVAMAATGLVFLTVRPIRVRASVGPSSGAATLSLRF